VEEGDHWIGKMTKQSLKVFTEGGDVAYAGWKEVPVWYLVTLEAKGLPVRAQRYIVQKAQDDGGDITIREIESGHSPMLSKPKETANFIRETVESLAG
jgi:hypothetical protein